MYKVKVYITLRKSVLDPQGTATKKSLHAMSFSEVQDVRIGKMIELTIEKKDQNIEQTVDDMCQRLLVNTVIEDYRFEIEEVSTQ